MLDRLDRFWFPPTGPERLAAVRILVGLFGLVYCCVRAPNLVNFSRFGPQDFEPVGPVAVLGAPLPAWLVVVAVVACIGTGAAFVVGWRFRVTGPLHAFLLLWVLSYRNSWGMVFHTENLLVLHVLVLGLARSADAHAMDARRASGPAHPRYGWPLKLLGTITVVAYVLAGVAKLRNSGFDWITSDILRNYIAYDNLRKIGLGDIHSPFGGWLVAHGGVFPPLAAFSVGLELLAPVALLGRRWAAGWCSLMWSFHLGVLAVMAIFFPYQLFGIAYLPYFRAERVLGWGPAKRVFGWLAAPPEAT